MKPVVHQNFFDEEGKVFCKKLNKVIELDINKCNSCDMCVGSLQGNGVECLWEDEDDKYPILAVNNPSKELLRVSKSSDIKKSVKITLGK